MLNKYLVGGRMHKVINFTFFFFSFYLYDLFYPYWFNDFVLYIISGLSSRLIAQLFAHVKKTSSPMKLGPVQGIGVKT